MSQIDFEVLIEEITLDPPLYKVNSDLEWPGGGRGGAERGNGSTLTNVKLGFFIQNINKLIALRVCSV